MSPPPPYSYECRKKLSWWNFLERTGKYIKTAGKKTRKLEGHCRRVQHPNNRSSRKRKQKFSWKSSEPSIPIRTFIRTFYTHHHWRVGPYYAKSNKWPPEEFKLHHQPSIQNLCTGVSSNPQVKVGILYSHPQGSARCHRVGLNTASIDLITSINEHQQRNPDTCSFLNPQWLVNIITHFFSF